MLGDLNIIERNAKTVLDADKDAVLVINVHREDFEYATFSP
jgi:hypothetical protein